MKILAAVCCVFIVAVSEGVNEERSFTHSIADVSLIIQDLQSQLTTLRQELHTLNSSLRQEIQAVKQLKKVAFSAVMDHVMSAVSIGHVIRYNKVLLNEGRHYDSITGIFTAPTAGVYQFSFFLGHDGTDIEQARIQLMVEGQSKAGAVVDGLHAYQDIQGGNVVIVRLNANDRVWMEVFHDNNGHIYGDNGFTTFSGSLLFE